MSQMIFGNYLDQLEIRLISEACELRSLEILFIIVWIDG